MLWNNWLVSPLMTKNGMKDNVHISDELLAAFLEGSTNEEETLAVCNALKFNKELRNVMGVALAVEDDMASSFDILPMMKLAAESRDKICCVLCEAYVLHRRNIPFVEQEILDLARDNNWLTSQGTPLYAIGQILIHYGLMVTHQYDASLQDMADALALDNDVLVVVNADKLYPKQSDVNADPNHAVVVTKVGANAVVLYDPQNDSHDSIPTSRFESAWNESHRYMVRVLQSVDDYEPRPINLSGVNLTDDLLDLREAIAENAHEIWAAARLKEGWSYGPVRDDVLKKHPDLVPYSMLPDSEKEYDRQMALDTIRLVERVGFALQKR